MFDSIINGIRGLPLLLPGMRSKAEKIDYDAHLMKGKWCESGTILLPELAFMYDSDIDEPQNDPAAGIYILDNGYFGFAIRCDPVLFGMGARTAKDISELLKTTFREDTFVNVLSYTSPDILPYTHTAKSKITGKNPTARSVARFLAENYERSATDLSRMPTDIYQFPVHDRQVMVTLKTQAKPDWGELDGMRPSINFLKSLAQVRKKFYIKLSELGMNPHYADPDLYIRFMNSIFNWSQSASWRHKKPNQHWNTSELLRNQIVDPFTTISKERWKEGLGHFNSACIREPDIERYMSVMVTERYPDEVDQEITNAFCGDVWRGKVSSFRKPNIVSTQIYMPAQKALSKDIYRKRHIWRFNNKGNQDDINNIHAQNDTEEVVKSLQQNSRLVFSCSTIVQFCNKQDIQDVNNDARTHFGNFGMKIIPYDGDPSYFLNALPFGGSKIFLSENKRIYHLCTEKHIPPLVPVCGDYKGMGDGGILAQGRTGQICLMDLHLGDKEPNGLVTGSTGSGKSFFFTHAQIISASNNRIIRLIEEGASSARAIKMIGGEYLDFDKDRSGGVSFNFNPYLMLEGIDIPPYESICDVASENMEEEYLKELEKIKKEAEQGAAEPEGTEYDEFKAVVEMIIAMHCEMATVSAALPLTAIQVGALRQIVYKVAVQYQHEAVIDDALALVRSHGQQEVKNLAEPLSEFASTGLYGDYFKRGKPVEWDNDVVGLELEKLNETERVKSIILMNLCMSILKELGNEKIRHREKVIALDETWSLLKNIYVAMFIARLYRQIRKRNGSIIMASQGVSEILDSPAAAAAMANSYKKFMLWQAGMSLDFLKKAHIFGDEEKSPTSKFYYDWLSSVHTNKTEDERYSEFLVYTESSGVGVVRFTVPKFFEKLYTTTASESSELMSYQKMGYSEMQAIVASLEKRGYDKAHPEMKLFSKILSEEEMIARERIKKEESQRELVSAE